jgi:hypothetical protein
MAGSRGPIDQAAAAAGLGRPGGTFRNLRYIPPTVAWAAVGGAAVWGLLLAVTGAYLIAPLVVPVVLIILAVVRYRATPAGGRRWLMLYEQGLAEVASSPTGGPAQVRLVRWSEVTDAGVRLADFAPAGKLRASLAPHVPSLPRPAGTGVALTALGFVALAILPALVPVARTLPSRPTADVITFPTFSPSPSLFSSPTPSLSPSATVLPLPMPTNTEAFYDVCKGTAFFPAAPAYAGPPPHLIYATIPTYTDPDWWANVPAKIQLAVCTETSLTPGTKIRKCPYRFDDGTLLVQQLVKATWTVTIREARTGRQVASHSIVGGKTSCSPVPEIDSSNYPPEFGHTQLTWPTNRQIYDTVGKYVLR